MTDQDQTDLFLSKEDVLALVDAKKELLLIETQMKLAAANVELLTLRIQKKYNLSDSDSVDITSGKVTRA